MHLGPLPVDRPPRPSLRRRPRFLHPILLRSVSPTYQRETCFLPSTSSLIATTVLLVTPGFLNLFFRPLSALTPSLSLQLSPVLPVPGLSLFSTPKVNGRRHSLKREAVGHGAWERSPAVPLYRLRSSNSGGRQTFWVDGTRLIFGGRNRIGH